MLICDFTIYACHSAASQLPALDSLTLLSSVLAIAVSGSLQVSSSQDSASVCDVLPLRTEVTLHIRLPCS